ncbi:hypothetical protein ACK85Q_005025, partial [Salmonella enterica]
RGFGAIVVLHRLPSCFRYQKQKPRSPLTFGVFAFISFVNQKSADFVLSVRLVPCHFLVKYSTK